MVFLEGSGVEGFGFFFLKEGGWKERRRRCWGEGTGEEGAEYVGLFCLLGPFFF